MANGSVTLCPKCNGYMNFISTVETVARATLEVVDLADEYRCNYCDFVEHY